MNTQDKIKAIEDKLEKLWYVCTKIEKMENWQKYVHFALPNIAIFRDSISIYPEGIESLNFIFNNDNWFEEFNKAFDEIVNNTLGKNTVRMMKIGQVQDELEKLGFSQDDICFNKFICSRRHFYFKNNSVTLCDYTSRIIRRILEDK